MEAATVKVAGHQALWAEVVWAVVLAVAPAVVADSYTSPTFVTLVPQAYSLQSVAILTRF